MNKPIVDKEIEVTIFLEKNYEGYGTLRFSDKGLAPFIGQKKKKYHVIVEEVNENDRKIN